MIATPAQADMRRAERALDGPRPPYVDPGPAKPIAFTGIVEIRFFPAHVVRTLCPQAIDWHSLACTNPVTRVITMADEDSSGLSAGRWIALLRHELRHAMGDDFHGPRP
jgi:hypothetical protein